MSTNMKTTLPLTRRQVYKFLLFHYVILFIIATWAGVMTIFINGLYVEYKIKKIMETSLSQSY